MSPVLSRGLIVAGTHLLVVLSLWLLGGCQAIQQGPPVELAEIAVPKVVPDAAQGPPVVVPPEPVRRAPVARGTFKAWIPPHVTANGDVYEGHYVEVSDQAPQKVLVKPDYEIPRTPRQITRPVVKKDLPASTSPPAMPSSRPPLAPAPGPPFIPPMPQEEPYGTAHP